MFLQVFAPLSFSFILQYAQDSSTGHNIVSLLGHFNGVLSSVASVPFRAVDSLPAATVRSLSTVPAAAVVAVASLFTAAGSRLWPVVADLLPSPAVRQAKQYAPGGVVARWNTTIFSTKMVMVIGYVYVYMDVHICISI